MGLLNYEEWHVKRRDLMNSVEKERQANWQRSMPHVSVAVTEMALRELYDRVQALEERRGPGRPPKEVA